MDSFNRDHLKSAIKGTVVRLYTAQNSDLDLYRNTLDCFSASIDALIQNISMEDWLIQEKERQVQKTKQNAIGSLHEDIMGSIAGVESLPVGNLIDIISNEKLLVAEVKNKHNTTKGNHKVQIYRDLAQKLDELQGYTGYYVEILPKGAKAYNTPFSPSDNQTKTKLPAREDIRVIDGKSFYALLTGNENALEELYTVLPNIVAEIVQEEFNQKLSADRVTSSTLFGTNFSKAYG
ncbi:Eco47II family restriction endonuclease [Colwellia ponticola]|uniref:Eco47II family restriction endonuclease n=1 Tax=Colwellia ponticola TaxID=2304625 RepID=A0A8H2PMU7_9GAMM|nr:Eco47II family restriction endonuclease [Colwellia ponticola]TMM47029.1 Eco47II family restriction endonuclease [Colwellia ponticola]